MKLVLGTIFAVLTASSVACTSTVDEPTNSTNDALRRGGRDGSDVSSDGAGSDGSCPPGTETEIEHGSTTCKAHGGNGTKDGSSDDSDGSATGGSSCTTNADCAPGLECETEVEHGLTTSFCKKHGGRD